MWTFGSSVEYDMDVAERECGPEAKSHTVNLARQRVYDRYMQENDQEATTSKGRFADPMELIAQRPPA